MTDKQLESITAGELMDKRLVNNPFIIPGLLPTGTYILAGAPKAGKSFLMAQLCWCVSEGAPFLSRPVNRCETLYLALEDTQPRLQERLGRMFGVEWAGTGFHLVFQAEMKGDALLQQLDNFLFEHPDIQLVVIDTLQRVREYHGSQYSYSNDYEDIRPFKEYTDTHELALILVHHTRKDETGSPFDRISGTNGLLGAADGAFLLYSDKLKQRLKEEGSELVTNCHQLKMTAADGKKRVTDVATTEQLLRIIQSVPSRKAEPFKLWLAQVGWERIEETIDPELAIDRAVETYQKKAMMPTGFISVFCPSMSAMSLPLNGRLAAWKRAVSLPSLPMRSQGHGRA